MSLPLETMASHAGTVGYAGHTVADLLTAYMREYLPAQANADALEDVGAALRSIRDTTDPDAPGRRKRA